jgi:hypothetical protein
MIRLNEPPRHGKTHVAQADKSDLHHRPPSSR